MFIHQHHLLISRSCHPCYTHHPCFHLTTQGASGLDGKPGPRVSPSSFCVTLRYRVRVLSSRPHSPKARRNEGQTSQAFSMPDQRGLQADSWGDVWGKENASTCRKSSESYKASLVFIFGWRTAAKPVLVGVLIFLSRVRDLFYTVKHICFMLIWNQQNGCRCAGVPPQAFLYIK